MAPSLMSGLSCCHVARHVNCFQPLRTRTVRTLTVRTLTVRTTSSGFSLCTTVSHGVQAGEQSAQPHLSRATGHKGSAGMPLYLLDVWVLSTTNNGNGLKSRTHHGSYFFAQCGIQSYIRTHATGLQSAKATAA